MSALFDPGREGYSLGELDWNLDDVRVMLVKSTYAYNAAHKFLSDLPATTYDNGRSVQMTNCVAPSGVHDADDTSMVATLAVACNALIIFKNTGVDATARLIAYIDTATGLPLTPAAGGTVNIAWLDSGNRIFKL